MVAEKTRKNVPEAASDRSSTCSNTPIEGQEGMNRFGKTGSAEATELTDLEELGIGVLVCCGKKLRWWRERGSAVFEAECGNCGTSYAMARGYDCFEMDDEDPRESYGSFLRSAS